MPYFVQFNILLQLGETKVQYYFLWRNQEAGIEESNLSCLWIKIQASTCQLYIAALTSLFGSQLRFQNKGGHHQLLWHSRHWSHNQPIKYLMTIALVWLYCRNVNSFSFFLASSFDDGKGFQKICLLPLILSCSQKINLFHGHNLLHLYRSLNIVLVWNWDVEQHCSVCQYLRGIWVLT